jgi:hypothetical protein
MGQHATTFVGFFRAATISDRGDILPVTDIRHAFVSDGFGRQAVSLASSFRF